MESRLCGVVEEPAFPKQRRIDENEAVMKSSVTEALGRQKMKSAVSVFA